MRSRVGRVFCGIIIIFVWLFCTTASPLAAQGNPVPLVSQPLVPDTVAPGEAGFTLTLNGTGFVPGAVVNWDGSARATAFVRGTQLTAAITAADIAKPGTASVTVVNPAPGAASNVVFFSITKPTPSINFTTRAPLGVGFEPDSVVVGDFNGDGRLDLAVANAGSNTVDVMLGDGTGSFNLVSSANTGSKPFALAVGDFNGDGRQDLAVVNFGDNTVSILLGDGNGKFTLMSSPTTGAGPSAITVGDFNGDGRLDLAVANEFSNTVSILLGDGTGNFTLASAPATGTLPLSIATGDFNGDGIPDMVTANYTSNTASILLGDGTGNFTLASSPTAGSGPYSVAVADFNGDGILDLAVTDGNSNGINILVGDGTGNFTLASSSGSGFVSVAVGDFNGDNKLDLAAAYLMFSQNDDHTVVVSLGVGAGNFSTLGPFAAGFFPLSLALGDFNGDGKLDIAVANSCGSDAFCQTAGTISILQQIPVPVVALSPSDLRFSSQLVNTTSPPKKVKLTNSGEAALNISTIGVSVDFSETDTCGSSLGTKQSCIISVAFTPRVAGTQSGILYIEDNAIGSPQVLTLTGRGTVVALTPAGLNFGPQRVGSSSGAKTLQLTNTGSISLKIANIAITGVNQGDFAQTNTCGSSVAAGGSCTISVTFTPTALGARSAFASIADSGGGSPQTVALSGTGT